DLCLSRVTWFGTQPSPLAAKIVPVVPAGAGYPGLGGGLWLRMIFPPGLVTWLVPSGKTVSCQPIWWSTTWWCHQQ
ncbi:MAG TPA: hypothetical protein VIX86_21550, partial [Streptosporangiaceae bacterium]